MRAEIARAKSTRDGGRHASDSREAEWRPIALDSRPASLRDAGAARICARRSTPSCTSFALAVRGACRWRRFRRGGRCPGIFRLGAIAVCGYRSAIALCWRRAGRRAGPSADGVDGQSAKTTESGGPRGFDAGKKVKGRKRHIVTDTGGLLVTAQARAADIQDRDGAPELLASGTLRFSLAAPCVCRRRLCGSETPGRARWQGAVADRCRETLRHHARLRAVAAPMGRRTDIGLVEPSPASGQGIRGDDRHGAGMALHRKRAAPHPKNGKGIKVKLIPVQALIRLWFEGGYVVSAVIFGSARSPPFSGRVEAPVG